MKFLSGLLAFISSLFIVGESPSKLSTPISLNTDPIAYQETYFAPVVAEPGNFPFTKKIITEKTNEEVKPKQSIPTVVTPVEPPIQNIAVAPPPLPPPLPLVVLPPAEPEDPYLPKTEPITDWLSANLSFLGKSSEGDRTLPDITFDREYWRAEVFSYWATDVAPPKPAVEKDYFKMEVYESGTNKLIYTMTSGVDDSMHRSQVFKKAGKYYAKIYSKPPSQWEITFTVSPKLAQ